MQQNALFPDATPKPERKPRAPRSEFARLYTAGTRSPAPEPLPRKLYHRNGLVFELFDGGAERSDFAGCWTPVSTV